MRHRIGALIVLGAGFAAGVIASRSVGEAEASRRGATYRALDVFTEVYEHIRRNHVAPVATDALIRSAIEGMVDHLDPHSEFLSPDEKALFRQQARGRFPGVGMEVGLRDGELVIIAPLPGAPAAAAGVQPGDRLRGIDGHSTRGMTLGDAMRRLRGAAGTSVEMTLSRGDSPQFTVRVERAVVEVEPVEGRLLPDGSAHLRVRTFQKNTESRLRAEIERLRVAAGGALPGVVLDMRDNPGGLLSQAIAVSDMFLTEGDIVSTRSRGQAGRKWSAGTLGTLHAMPLVAVVNAGTASAAEIVVGALQAHRRAVVVGTRTFGKGSVQTIYDLTDGSGLKLTVAHYFTPDGRSIQARGIVPDVHVTAADALERTEPAAAIQREADLDRRLANPDGARWSTSGPPPAPRDPVLARAVEVLRVAGIFSQRE